MSVSIERGKGKASKQFYLRVTNDNPVKEEKLVHSEHLPNREDVFTNALGTFKQLAALFNFPLPKFTNDDIEDLKWQFHNRINDNSTKKKKVLVIPTQGAIVTSKKMINALKKHPMVSKVKGRKK